jgi:CRP-like cAMP-binding protein
MMSACELVVACAREQCREQISSATVFLWRKTAESALLAKKERPRLLTPVYRNHRELQECAKLNSIVTLSVEFDRSVKTALQECLHLTSIGATMAQLTAVSLGLRLKSGFLEGLAPTELRAILGAARVRHFTANSVITRQETAADCLFLLVRGRVRHFFITPDGRKVVLFGLLPGDTFGGSALLSRLRDYLVSTEAVKDSWVLRWDRKTIRGLATRYPRLVENELSTGSDYLVWYLSTHLALTCPDARSRLANVLSNLARGVGDETRYGPELDITNEELANAANLTPFTVSRLLGEWQRQGSIVKRRGKVLVRLPERLPLQSA